jgi:hypothetical protein
MSTPIAPLTVQDEAASEDVLARRLQGSLLAEDLRRIADRPEYARYKALVYSCLNSVLIEAARTPEKDQRRILDALRQYGGGTCKDIARQAKLPASDMRQTLAQLCAAGLVVVRARGEQRGADALLYFLTDDPNALDFRPA